MTNLRLNRVSAAWNGEDEDTMEDLLCGYLHNDKSKQNCSGKIGVRMILFFLTMASLVQWAHQTY